MTSMTAIKITNYKPYRKGALSAFFSATLPSGLVIHGLKLFVKESGNRWLGLPSEKFTDKKGVEGFRPILEFTDRHVADKFREAVLQAIDGLAGGQKPAAAASKSGAASAQIPADDSDIPF